MSKLPTIHDIAGAPILACLSVLMMLGLARTACAEAGTASPSSPRPASSSRLPTLFVIGDSTVNNHTKGLLGWGDPLADYFDKTRIHVENRARGGRSSRTFYTEGLWDQVLAQIKPGDFVLMQFGHNDGGSLTQGRARASLKGNGEETQEIPGRTAGQKEVVHTYGWYLRKYVADTRARGATPIVLSPVPRNIWKDDHTVARSSNDYGKWAAEAAKAGGASFVDLNDIIAKHYEEAGPQKVKTLYFGTTDHTHTTVAGAQLNAASVVEGIKGLNNCPLRRFLSSGADMPKGSFEFGSGKAAPGSIRVPPTTTYTRERGYGFEEGMAVSADKPFFFSVDLPEGNYNVKVTLGDPAGESTTTVKAELRRLMLEKVHTAPGKFATRTFTVNIRTPRIATGGEVGLKEREKTAEAWNWDDRLTLEFSNTRPRVEAIEIMRADDVPTIYLLGDSTVCDQPREPYNSWGQMLPRFFKPGVAVANHAESGESLRSSLGARRLDKVLSTLRAGDYLFLQYGHNDQKEHGEGIGAFTTYRADLKRFLQETRRRGGIPVLVTPMNRRTFDGSGKITNSLGDYPEAVRRTAKEENVPLIDLNAMSKRFYEALGPEVSKRAFAPGDGTHHNDYGSYELARCIVEGIKQNKLGIVSFLTDDVPPFDPDHPDPLDSFALPADPEGTHIKPCGS